MARSTHPRGVLDRLTNWSPVLLLGSLAALTFWLDAQVQPPQPRIDGSARHDPNLFVERFRATTFDADGRVRQSLAAQRAQFYPDDNSIDFTTVSMVMTDPDSPRVTVSADSGSVTGDRETVTLAGNVRATRDAAPVAAKPKGGKPDAGPGGPVTLSTEYLRVVPKQGRATTDRAVTIEEPRGIIHAVGMEVDTKAQTLRLKSGVRGTLQPQAPSK
jgi:lipopolysaccharide export system protein LptC